MPPCGRNLLFLPWNGKNVRYVHKSREELPVSSGDQSDRFHNHLLERLNSFKGSGEPEILFCSMTPICPKGADVGQWSVYPTFPEAPALATIGPSSRSHLGNVG